MNLNNGDKKMTTEHKLIIYLYSRFDWWHPEYTAKYFMIVTIVEIHRLILDVFLNYLDNTVKDMDIMIFFQGQCRSNDCEMIIMLKHSEITFSLCSSGCCNSGTAAKQRSEVNHVRVKSPTKGNTHHSSHEPTRLHYSEKNYVFPISIRKHLCSVSAPYRKGNIL